LAFARTLEHPFTLASALANAAWLRVFRGMTQEAVDLTAEQIRLCTDEAIPGWLAYGHVLMASNRCEAREPDGPEAMQAALDEFVATGGQCLVPYWRALHADAVSAAGDHERAATLLHEAFAMIERTHERWAAPEVHRLQGLILQRGGAEGAVVEKCYRRAVGAAREQGARAWELRATIALADCLAQQRRDEEARTVLAAVLSAYAPDVHSADVARARAMVRDLGE
jgi:predicted ATPase